MAEQRRLLLFVLLGMMGLASSQDEVQAPGKAPVEAPVKSLEDEDPENPEWEKTLGGLWAISGDSKKTKLSAFVDTHMDPGGVVCIGYVNEGSDNHNLMKKIASPGYLEDPLLYDLGIPFVVVLTEKEAPGKEEESLQIVKRNSLMDPQIFKSMNMEHHDLEPIVFKAKPKKWKKNTVRQWLVDNAFPTVNYRLLGSQNKTTIFPYSKYFPRSPSGGVGLLLMKIGSTWEPAPQFHATRVLQPYIDTLTESGLFHFAVMEKDNTNASLVIRRWLKLGLDDSIDMELVLIENAGTTTTREGRDENWHGNPKKYRLTDLTTDAAKVFFDSYFAGKLPTYWASKDEEHKTAKRDHGNLTSWTFEDVVYNADPQKGVLVAFFDDDPKGKCMTTSLHESKGRASACQEGREVWEQVSKEVQLRDDLNKDIVVASIDQYANEHPENLVKGRLYEPQLVWYPPGTPKSRKKRRTLIATVFHQKGAHTTDKDHKQAFSKKALLTRIDDLIEDAKEDADEEL